MYLNPQTEGKTIVIFWKLGDPSYNYDSMWKYLPTLLHDNANEILVLFVPYGKILSF